MTKFQITLLIIISQVMDLLSICNGKGFKTPFHRSGHMCSIFYFNRIVN